MNNKKIVLLPYLNMGYVDQLKFNFGDDVVTILNSSCLDTYCDQSDLESINQLISIYKTYHHHEPVRKIGMVAVNDFDFRTFNDEEQELIQQAIKILFICSLHRSLSVKYNSGHYSTTSDNFLLEQWAFKDTHPTLSRTDGYIIPVWRLDSVKTTEIKYPPYLLTSEINIDEDLKSRLLKLKQDDEQLYARIMQATEAIMSSYYNGINYEKSRLLMMNIALLNLFDIGSHSLEIKQLRGTFIQFEQVDEREDRQIKIQMENHKKPSTCQVSKHVEWIHKFYKLRNSIIHADELSDNDLIYCASKYTQFAPYYFILGVLNYIQLNESYSYSIRENLNALFIDWKQYGKLAEKINKSGSLSTNEQKKFIDDNANQIFSFLQDSTIYSKLKEIFPDNWFVTFENLQSENCHLAKLWLLKYKDWIIKRINSDEYKNLKGMDEWSGNITNLLFPNIFNIVFAKMIVCHERMNNTNPTANNVCLEDFVFKFCLYSLPDVIRGSTNEDMDRQFDEMFKAKIQEIFNIDKVLKTLTGQFLFPNFHNLDLLNNWINILDVNNDTSSVATKKKVIVDLLKDIKQTIHCIKQRDDI